MAEIKWVRLSDKRPEDGKSYLTCSARGAISVKKFHQNAERILANGHRLSGFDSTCILFWAELPEGPKEYLAELNEAEARKVEEEIERLKKKVETLRGGAR